MTIQRPIKSSFGLSLLWLWLLVIVAFSVNNVVELIFTDFIHGNPHRTQQNAIEMMFLFPLIGGVVAFVGIILVFGIPQIFQAALAKVLLEKFNQLRVAWIVAAVPITTILTWYCFDYLTPSNFNLGINEGADWVPYEHGLTLKRYFITFAIQLAVTALTVFQFLVIQIKTRKIVLLSLVGLAIIGGGFFGYHQALGQYKFL